MRYFTKANIANTIYVNGRELQFTEIEGGMGVITAEDQDVISALEQRIRERRGGITEVSAEQHAELLQKKSGSSLPPTPQLRSGAESRPSSPQPPSQPSAPAVEGAAKPAVSVSADQVQPPATGDTRPTTSKIKRA